MFDSNWQKAAPVIGRILKRKTGDPEADAGLWKARAENKPVVSEKFTSFASLPAYESISMLAGAAKRFGIENPFFKVHEGTGGHVTRIDGKEYLNFSHYNYLGLTGHPEVNKAAKDAIDRFGTSVSASRLVAGERALHQQLEDALARLLGTEACLVMVSGHATNVGTISTLFGPKDLVVHDSLIHNSVLEGIRLSGATRRAFPHNNLDALDDMLTSLRSRFERTLIVVEGLYSMDGDIPNLPRLVEIKRKRQAFLMVDEAHSLGVLGKTGRGCGEHFGVAPADVDIWMGTLSKTLAGCGGYIAGSAVLVDLLKHEAPGFVYSVGLAPPLAAASLEALNIMLREPERVATLRQRAAFFLSLIRKAGLDAGTSQGFSVIPVIVGSSRKAVALSNALFEHGVNALPIIHPAVEEKSARLRFFLSCMHSEDALRNACNLLERLVHGRNS